MGKKKMAFVDLTNYKDWPMGGMLEYELAILKYLVEEYDVDIYGVSVNGNANRELIINGKKHPIHIWCDAKTRKKIIPNYWRGLGLISLKHNFPKDYDIVYAHTGSCVIALNAMVDRKKTKVLYHQHGLNHMADYSLMSLIQRPGLAAAQRLADIVFVVSNVESVRAFAEKMKNKTKAKFIPIGSPLDLSKFDEEKVREKIRNRKQEKSNVFLYTGRLSAFKNARMLISAMKLYVEKKDSKALLYIAGSGDEFNNLKKQVKTEKLDGNVKLLGPVSHDMIYKLLDEADVFVTASGGEGVSVSVLEAYASGLPVVCFKVPGLEGQIRDGITGVFAKEKTPNSFCDAMIKVVEKRNELGLHCLDEARKYDSAIIAKTIIDEINFG